MIPIKQIVNPSLWDVILERHMLYSELSWQTDRTVCHKTMLLSMPP